MSLTGIADIPVGTTHSAVTRTPKLKIALLTELFQPSIGGQEIFFTELGATLAERGHQVDVYCISHAKHLPYKEEIQGVRVFRYPTSPRYKQPIFKMAKRDWLAIMKYSSWVRTIAHENAYDYYLLNQWPLAHATLLPRKMRENAALHWCEVRNPLHFRFLQSKLPRMVHANYAISTSVASEICRASGHAVKTLPSGIRCDRYRCENREQRKDIAYLGRIAEHKNLPLLIDAYTIARGLGLAGRLVIAGDGPEHAAVSAYAAASPAAASIDMLGLIDEAAKIDLLARSALLVLPSKREGFPRVVSEAMASGLPVVTPDFSENGTKDIVRQFGCGLVSGGTPEQLAAAMLRAIADWTAYSNAGRLASLALDWNNIADMFEADIQRHVQFRNSI